MKNNNFKPLTKREEWLGEQIVDAAYCVHKKLGLDYSKKYMKIVFDMNFQNAI